MQVGVVFHRFQIKSVYLVHIHVIGSVAQAVGQISGKYTRAITDTTIVRLEFVVSVGLRDPE